MPPRFSSSAAGREILAEGCRRAYSASGSSATPRPEHSCAAGGAGWGSTRLASPHRRYVKGKAPGGDSAGPFLKDWCRRLLGISGLRGQQDLVPHRQRPPEFTTLELYQLGSQDRIRRIEVGGRIHELDRLAFHHPSLGRGGAQLGGVGGGCRSGTPTPGLTKISFSLEPPQAARRRDLKRDARGSRRHGDTDETLGIEDEGAFERLRRGL